MLMITVGTLSLSHLTIIDIINEYIDKRTNLILSTDVALLADGQILE